MYLEILRHDGPARLGKLHFNDQVYQTPSLLWSKPAGELPEEYLEISSPDDPTDDFGLISYGTIFSQHEVAGFGILPSFPSGFETPIEIAREAVAETVKYSEKYPEYGVVLEGGKYLELRIEGGEQFKERPIIKIADADRLIRNHRKLVSVITAIRDTASPNTALYMPGVSPHLFAILVYMGVDIFDLKPAILGAHENIYLTLRGGLALESIVELPCPCEVCVSNEPKDFGFEELLKHNIQVTTSAIREVREAIRAGMLRELVEERAANDINAMGALRILDSDRQDFLERYTLTSPMFSHKKPGG
jgi:queuine/archaeosine tRNA-ribosyltransferase